VDHDEDVLEQLAGCLKGHLNARTWRCFQESNAQHWTIQIMAQLLSKVLKRVN
jgi:hypothetical protein